MAKTRKPKRVSRRTPKMPEPPKMQTVDARPLFEAVSQTMSEQRAWVGGILNAIRVDLERMEGCVRTVIDGQKRAGLHPSPGDSSLRRPEVVAQAAVASAMEDAAARMRAGGL